MKPILFSTEMVRAILDGHKTVTRRVVKPQPFAVEQDENTSCWCGHFVSGSGKVLVDKPPYRPGGILYVRETWRHQPLKWSRDGGYSDFVLQYRADFADEENDCYGRRGGIAPQKWNPSIYMPREAARIFLRVTGVRVERLQEIDGRGVLAEGVDNGHSNPTTGKRWENMQLMAFSALWDSAIKLADRDLYGWDANPWVWVIEFERCGKPKEAVP